MVSIKSYLIAYVLLVVWHFLLVGKIVNTQLPAVIPDIGQGHFDQFVGAIFAYFHRKYLNGIRFWFVVCYRRQ